MLRIKKVVFISVVVLLTLILIFIVSNRKVYGVWNPLRSPLRAKCYDRTYNLSPNPKLMEMSGENQPEYEIEQSFLDMITGKKFYMNHPKGEYVPTVIYLYVEQNKYYGCELSGGP